MARAGSLMFVLGLGLACVVGGAADGGREGAAVDVLLRPLPTPRQPGLLARRQAPAHRVPRPPALALQRMSGGAGDLVTCRIEVQVENTRPGDTVVLLGGNPALQAWNKQAAIELATTEDDFPWWTAEVQLPPGEPLEYKFAIRRCTARGPVFVCVRCPAQCKRRESMRHRAAEHRVAIASRNTPPHILAAAPARGRGSPCPRAETVIQRSRQCRTAVVPCSPSPLAPKRSPPLLLPR